MMYLLYAGFRRKSDRRGAIAAASWGGESLIFAANGFHCPLTQVAGNLGAERGGVTDIFLPRWFAHYLPAIHVPLLVLATWLHARTILRNGSPDDFPHGVRRAFEGPTDAEGIKTREHHRTA